MTRHNLYVSRRQRKSNPFSIDFYTCLFFILGSLIFSFFIAFFPLSAETVSILYFFPDIPDEKGILHETWTCQSCGYENWIMIETCAVCGQAK
jgi:hypothetical protein